MTGRHHVGHVACSSPGPHPEPQKPTPPFELANCNGCVPELQSRGAGPEVRGYKAKQTTCSWAHASRPGVHTLLVEVKGFALLPGSRVCLGSTRTHSVGARLISHRRSSVNKGMACTHGSKLFSTHPGPKTFSVCPHPSFAKHQPLFSVLDFRARYP